MLGLTLSKGWHTQDDHGGHQGRTRGCYAVVIEVCETTLDMVRKVEVARLRFRFNSFIVVLRL
jgi:hypothetical protein